MVGWRGQQLSYFYLNQPRGRVRFCWQLTKKADIETDPVTGSDYYVMRAVSYWTHDGGNPSDPAWMYQNIRSSVVAKDNVYYSTENVSSSSSCTHPITVSVGHGPLQVSTELQMCSGYGITRYSYSSQKAEWYSTKVGGLRKVETVYSQKVKQGERPTFRVEFGTPQYQSECNVYCQVNSHLVWTWADLTPRASGTVWNNVVGGAGSGGGGDGGGGSAPPNEHKADLTGDGIADLVRYRDDGHLYVYPGRGGVEANNAFWAPRDQGPDWTGTVSVAQGDLNRNGITDLVRYKNNGHLYLYPGRGDSQATNPFWAPRDLGPDWIGTVDLALGDLNRDGIADLVRYRNDGHMYLYPGRGGVEASNAFWAPRDLGDWSGTVSIALGDLNRDGIADLVRYRNDGHMYLYPGRGGVEASNAFWAPRDLGDWSGTVSIALGDLNRDGIADLVRYRNDGHMYLYPGRGGVEASNAFWAPRDLGGWSGTVSISL